MRHSKIDLTMTLYTDPRLLDVAGALDTLPSLPLTGGSEREAVRATGTDGEANLLPGTGSNLVAPTFDKSRATLSFLEDVHR